MMKSRKILILGAGVFQVPAIQKARDLGYYIIVCTNNPNDPGIEIAQKYYSISTIDREGVLRIAREEKVDGIMTIASEIAAVTVAYVCEILRLPGYSLESARIISNKFLLREFLNSLGVSNVGFASVSSLSEAEYYFYKLGGNVFLKPLSLSGSRGVFHVRDVSSLSAAFKECSELSRNFGESLVLIEESLQGVELGGEAVIWEGRIQLLVITKKFLTSTYVPYSHLLPNTEINSEVSVKIRSLLNTVVSNLGIMYGPLNFDLMFDGKEVKIIELGGRLGGNCLPELTRLHTGTDTIEIIARMSVGDYYPTVFQNIGDPTLAYILHSLDGGILREDIEVVIINSPFYQFIYAYNALATEGEMVQPFRSGSDQIGYILFKFPSIAVMHDMFRDIITYKWVRVYD